MTPGEQATSDVSLAKVWNADIIFKLFSDPVRRNLLLAVARHELQAPSQLADKLGRNLDATLKRLLSLRANGILLLKADKVDKRRQFCFLAPGIPLIVTEKGKLLDFGYLRLPINGASSTDQSTSGSTAPGTPITWDPDVVYSMMSDSVRRKLVSALAHTPAQSASELKHQVGRKLDATLKHLSVLRAGGFVGDKTDGVDGRRQVYSLSPTVPWKKCEDGIVLAFGFCTIRI